MIQTIYLDPMIRKEMGRLRRSGTAAAKAADRAEEIIVDLQEFGRVSDDRKNVITKHGELRIDNCRKYNLGSGYRLVTIKDGKDLFLTRIGSHDECNQWIENNRNFRPDTAILRYEVCLVCESPPDDINHENETVLNLKDEETWEPEIDEKYLRRVFCGITGETS